MLKQTVTQQEQMKRGFFSLKKSLSLTMKMNIHTYYAQFTKMEFLGVLLPFHKSTASVLRHNHSYLLSWASEQQSVSAFHYMRKLQKTRTETQKTRKLSNKATVFPFRVNV